ncbi:MAG: exodeoxyribonuclease VII small subunit [Gammaproteobacteria bacterium CG11_big_fil_rev_8_21_14_0_20_46_22]|nr:MAG: exodeoxyribonuclease VII small subunit [Gammaproteobacteria bacterium CG12_big_fil_rev_8_21_14_0_65_46_12]PIR11091.1 MAG: exodeoxyribonuclease VII small subunit [Gammaproteobacteria bacterium CG11_big_fil_rev_8_21_14_0_20_46_22]
MPAAKKTDTLEASLKKLESIVDKLEGGQLDLEASLALFEEGVSLTKTCQKKLGDAEKKIKILTDKHGLVDFDEDE